MSHLQFHRAILSRNIIARLSCSMKLCMSHTATLSHKQELANQRSPHSRDKVTRNTQFGKGVARLLRSCAARHVTLAILSRDKVADVTSV